VISAAGDYLNVVRSIVADIIEQKEGLLFPPKLHAIAIGYAEGSLVRTLPDALLVGARTQPEKHDIHSARHAQERRESIERMTIVDFIRDSPGAEHAADAER
jgi:hypothetical protein